MVWRGVEETLPGGIGLARGPDFKYFGKGVQVYYREGLEGFSHRVAQPLLAGTVYVWAVRTRNGTEVGPWSTYSSHNSKLDRFLATGSFNGYSFDFQTPLPSRVEAPAAPVGTAVPAAALVLTPDLCSTQMIRGDLQSIHQTGTSLEVGRAVCDELEASPAPFFGSLKRVKWASLAGDSHYLLLPSITDVQARPAGFNKELVTVTVKWTVNDSSGRTVWSGTVQGSATGAAGSNFTYVKHLRQNLQSAARDAAQQSALALASVPELHGTSDPVN